MSLDFVLDRFAVLRDGTCSLTSRKRTQSLHACRRVTAHKARCVSNPSPVIEMEQANAANRYR
jgi:hypothetical protein